MAATKRKTKPLATGPQALLDSCYEDEPIELKDISKDRCIPSGIEVLNWSMNLPGYPQGRAVEMLGVEGSAKSGTVLIGMLNAIRMGGCGIYIDTEHSLDLSRLRTMGFPMNSNGKPEHFYYCAPHSLEEAHRMIENVVRNYKQFETPILLCWDSFTAAGPKSLTEAVEAGKKRPAIGALMNADWLRSGILADLDDTPIAFVIINQVRDSIGDWSPNPQRKTTSAGGRAIKYYVSIRMEMSTTGQIKAREGENVPGIYVNAKILKNRFGPSHRSANYPFYFESGVDDVQSVIRYAEMKGVLEKGARKGSVIYNDREVLKSALWHYMQENPDEYKLLKLECKTAYDQKTPVDSLMASTGMDEGDD